ncbi:MAG: hypothetical protein JRC90_10445 [Deltaproteobacteria bacterium]|nr:hypothetical protein [Deltaproteobacteria bacterium]
MTEFLTQDEEDARYSAELREELEEQDRLELEDRVKNDYVVGKINDTSKMCQRFLNSDLGRFIQNEAIKESEDAKDKLASLKMKNFGGQEQFLDKIKELQYAAHIPALVITWLYRAIQRAEEEAKIKYEE